MLSWFLVLVILCGASCREAYSNAIDFLPKCPGYHRRELRFVKDFKNLIVCDQIYNLSSIRTKFNLLLQERLLLEGETLEHALDYTIVVMQYDIEKSLYAAWRWSWFLSFWHNCWMEKLKNKIRKIEDDSDDSDSFERVKEYEQELEDYIEVDTQEIDDEIDILQATAEELDEKKQEITKESKDIEQQIEELMEQKKKLRRQATRDYINKD